MGRWGGREERGATAATLGRKHRRGERGRGKSEGWDRSLGVAVAARAERRALVERHERALELHKLADVCEHLWGGVARRWHEPAVSRAGKGVMDAHRMRCMDARSSQGGRAQRAQLGAIDLDDSFLKN